MRRDASFDPPTPMLQRIPRRTHNDCRRSASTGRAVQIWSVRGVQDTLACLVPSPAFMASSKISSWFRLRASKGGANSLSRNGASSAHPLLSLPVPRGAPLLIHHLCSACQRGPKLVSPRSTLCPNLKPHPCSVRSMYSISGRYIRVSLIAQPPKASLFSYVAYI